MIVGEIVTKTVASDGLIDVCLVMYQHNICAYVGTKRDLLLKKVPKIDKEKNIDKGLGT